jgi:hypothetical protein
VAAQNQRDSIEHDIHLAHVTWHTSLPILRLLSWFQWSSVGGQSLEASRGGETWCISESREMTVGPDRE